MLYEYKPGNTENLPERIANLRKEYSQRSLDVQEVLADPQAQFQQWFEEALSAELPEANAMHLATVGADGRPAARIVLLKGLSENGLYLFYTNYDSRKGNHLADNPYAALTFFWPELERQIRIEGKVQQLSQAESYEYFRTRPRGSRIGAWASAQSRPLERRETLEQEWAQKEQEFPGEEIPLPPYWGGYGLTPEYYEFWQGRRNRLHDRITYARQSEGAWELGRLYP